MDVLSKESNTKIEKLHKRALQIIHDDFSSPYETLLLYDNSTTIHKRNLQFLMTEIFKTINNENPPFMKKIFVREDSVYNLRCMFRLKVPRVSVNHKEWFGNNIVQRQPNLELTAKKSKGIEKCRRL